MHLMPLNRQFLLPNVIQLWFIVDEPMEPGGHKARRMLE